MVERVKVNLRWTLILISIISVLMLLGMKQKVYADEDSVAPVLNKFTIVNTSVARPGVVQIQLNITEEDSGFSDFELSLSWNKNKVPQSGSISTGLEYGGAGGDMCSNFQLSIDQSGKQFGQYSGVYKFNLYIGKNANISEYTITRLWIRDKYGNNKAYEGEALSTIAFNGKAGFSITGNSSGDDYIPPVLNSYKIINTSVSRPGTVMIQLDVFEEGAGFSDFSVSLEWAKGEFSQSGNICTGLEYGGAGGDMCSNFEISLNKKSKQYGDNTGIYIFDLKIGEKANISNYTITELWIRDKAGNESRYTEENLSVLSSNGGDSFSVTGDPSADDTVAPVITSYEILNSTVNRPGVLKLKINITEEDSGLSDIDISLSWNKNGVSQSGSICTGLEYGGASGEMCSNFDLWNSNNESNFGGKTGSYIFTLLIGEKADLSTYTLDRIWIRDKYGNTSEIGTMNIGEPSNIIQYSSNGNNTFVLKDEFNYSFTTGTNNVDLAKKLNSMPVGSAAKVEIVGNKILSKESLDAIKGKDKTIVGYSSGVQWIIRGEQLTGETKDLNLGVTVSSINSGDSFAEGNNSNWTLSDDSVKLEFYPNGVLPGKIQVRFKSDSLYDKGIAGKVPALYYFDGEKLILEDRDSDLNFDGTDKWCFVNITHNSTFVVANTLSLKANASSPATPSSEPPATSSSEAPATPSSEPPATPSSEAPATPSSEPPATSSSEAPATPSSEPPATPSSEAPSAVPSVTPSTPPPAPAPQPAAAPAPAAVQEPITLAKTPAKVKAKVKKNKVTISWKKIKKNKSGKALLKQISSIQVQYSTDPAFTQNVSTKNVGKKKAKVTIKLQKKMTYYIRVRYVGNGGYSNWSKVKRIKTK